METRIEHYALIGDLRTAALVGVDGAMDWLSLPRFDSSAMFAALLGEAEHGHWLLTPAGGSSAQRRYRSETLILETNWSTPTGAARVTDFMVPGSSRPMVVRVVDGLVGSVDMRTKLAPRMGYGKQRPAVSGNPHHVVLVTDNDQLVLHSDVELALHGDHCAAEFAVGAGERRSFVLSSFSRDPYTQLPQVDEVLTSTEAFWTEWTSRSTYTGPWAVEVNQSLRILKALTYAPTGAMLAAATTSLPERIGGSRNWDYRYAWLRDATFAARAFLSTGHLEEVVAWRDWQVATLLAEPGDMQIMYAVDGAAELPEQTLDWLPGHRGSTPVRVGNAAARQQQNDVWGEVLDMLHAVRAAGVPDAPDQDKLEHALLDRIERCWKEPDNGMWEVRGPRRHFVHSKLMAWVGVDRMLRSAERCAAAQVQESELNRMRALRSEISTELLAQGFDARRGVFTQSFGSPRLDAAVLLMPRYGFITWDDPRFFRTVGAIQRHLADRGFVNRYSVEEDPPNVDGIPEGEGAFLAASFWLADALCGLGRTADAIALFRELLEVRNDVGLLSEEYDPQSGMHLGNTPQAFSHAGLVSTALMLSAAAEEQPAPGSEPSLLNVTSAEQAA